MRDEAPTSAPPAQSPPMTSPRRNWLGWLVAAAILISCALFIDLRSIGEALRRISAAEVVLLLGVYTVDRVLMGLKWGLLLRILDVRLPLWQAVRIFYQASFSGVFLPSHVGGDILRVLWVREATGETNSALASLVMERLLGFICSINLALLGAAMAAGLLAPDHLQLVILGGVVAAVTVNAGFALSLLPPVNAWVLERLGAGGGGLSKIRDALHRFYSAYARFSANRGAIMLNALLTLLEQCVQMVAVYVAARSLGLTVDPLMFFAASTVYAMILRFPIAPDGWGVGELASIGVYGLIGIGAADAFVISVLNHIMPMLALTPGFVFMLRGQSRVRPASLGPG